MTDECISPLRRRMIEDMTVRNFVPKTQSDYIRRFKNFAGFLGRPPIERAGKICAAISCIWRRAASAREPSMARFGAAVLLRRDARSRRYRQASAVCARAAQSADRVEPGGSRPLVSGGPRPQIQGGAQRHLWGGPAGVRSRRAQGVRYRQQAHDDPDRAGQGPQGPLRDALAAAARVAARLVAGLSLAGLAVPGP